MKYRKHRYIKEVIYKNDKSIVTNYIKDNKYFPDYIVNNNHIFYSNGYRTVLTSETMKESINPLDLTSAYPVEKFQSAIETKAIQDVFNNLHKEKIDIIKLLLFANLMATAILLYYRLKGGN